MIRLLVEPNREENVNTGNEEGIHVHMWQYQYYKRVVMASDMTAESGRVTI